MAALSDGDGFDGKSLGVQGDDGQENDQEPLCNVHKKHDVASDRRARRETLVD